MAGFQKAPRFLLRLLHLPPRLAYAIGLGPWLGRFVLLLTTTGRKSGRRRVTPLQYEEFDGVFYLGAALGGKSDWVRNIQANPQVEIRVKRRRFGGQARTIQDIGQIADFLELRLQRHPKMIGAIMRKDGIPYPPRRSDLEQYATQLTLVVVQPVDQMMP
jgi:deazaflavin-dependent oxidoreductase (nitroreductase family)